MKKFIAYFDYLGFAQFIENNDQEYQNRIVNNIFRDIEMALSNRKFKPSKYGVIADLTDNKINCINFSDTVVFWTDDDSLESLQNILKVTHAFTWFSIDYSFPLRGSLVCGELTTNHFHHTSNNGAIYNTNSVHGKGLVLAYSKAEAQNWAGAVIDESVIERIKFLGETPIDVLDEYAIKYKVPYKEDLNLNLDEEFVFRLFKSGKGKNSTTDGMGEFLKNMTQSVVANFGSHNKNTNHPNVKSKIENTVSFLNFLHDSYLREVDEKTSLG
ncbi:hypothetical protein [Emticicia sp. TH156]|uniref:hypothetical protein n=1 Tax=Emticicia sp. TH156 TaxID=2067454 RepID=UPI000C76493B|nr:hypothetical protein [Emticicia sp. TH156]PLK43517.1 hypothetical protein C0V77_16585 [Emticicia sp. TH156]